MKSKIIVLIHGMFMNSRCWEKWIPYYESKGFRVLAPAWPGRDKPVEELNAAHPDLELAKLKLNHIVDYMESFIKGLDEKPAIIGHSMGGLAVQVLLQRDVAIAGIAIDPAPPAGVFSTEWSFVKSNFPATNPFLLSKPVKMIFEHFQYAFVNTLPLDEQRAAYDRYVVPESRGVPTSSLGAAGKVDFNKLRRPLLITAGQNDHIIPPSLNKTNYQKYKGPSVTDFKKFAGRDHFLIGSKGWQEVADYCLNWLERIE
ncbi:MAG: alpha/beta fold hydrolase [Anaerolineales bacterium]|nr:alpha/beta fold hydrolase [Anaerolineales bacterium]